MPIWVSFFFDGTNNNLERDRGLNAHSNVAVLYRATRDAWEDGYFSFYAPGVGTRFEDIGEYGELPSGKSQGKGGDARINWALVQLLNAVHRRCHGGQRLVDPAELLSLITSSTLHAVGTTDNNLAGKRLAFAMLAKRLRASLTKEDGRPRLPRIAQIHLSVFGFSRGAAQARAFCFFLHHLLDRGHKLAGIPLRVEFLGLFDTVASVGVADAAGYIPFRGFGGWANGTLEIPTPLVRRTVHYVAAHEIRKAFPLSSIRDGEVYPPGCTEIVFPGAHSDVGGGYAPGDQGKAVGERQRLLSQVALVNMYMAAYKEGVPLMTLEELGQQGPAGQGAIEDLQIHPDTIARFKAYLAALRAPAGPLAQQVRGHMLRYWQWRESVRLRTPQARTGLPAAPGTGIATLGSYKAASAQDRIDLWESELDFCRQAVEPAKTSDAHQDFRIATRSPTTPAFEHMFDDLVHDSHASFYMTGPITAQDRLDKIRQAQRREAALRQSEARWEAHRQRQPNRQLPPLPQSMRLSPLERRILEHQKTHPGEYPLVTDADTEDLLDMDGLVNEVAVDAVAGDTRRESGGHVRYRAIYTSSRGVVDQAAHHVSRMARAAASALGVGSPAVPRGSAAPLVRLP
ncbi:DUF2235 domain-containing protein [Aquincola sp. MAHUQ-54]|uniref:DUF2235 domain-containing protein n=1 Tax=Aquincola agrisoli TaxID=3119538 RepID=A0AAW9QFR5_9BURK